MTENFEHMAFAHLKRLAEYRALDGEGLFAGTLLLRLYGGDRSALSS